MITFLYRPFWSDFFYLCAKVCLRIQSGLKGKGSSVNAQNFNKIRFFGQGGIPWV
jgi:hypothetical protein